MNTYWPGGGGADVLAVDATVVAVGAEGVGDGAAGVVEILSGISTDFQSSSTSTVSAINVPTLISLVPSCT